MPRHNEPRTSTGKRSRKSPLLDITSTFNQLQNGTSAQPEEAQALEYYSLLAKARAGSDEQQPQKPAGSKPERGAGYSIRSKMEAVEIFRYLKKTNKKVNASNFHQHVHRPINRMSITQWDKDFDKIKFNAAHGRGNKCTLSKSPADLIRHILDETVYEWLLEVRKNNGIVSGLQLEAAADSVLHILMDDICDFDDIHHGREISFTTSWRSRMTQEYGVAYCGLKGEAGSVDKDAIAKRMNEIRNICSNFEPDDIYNCDETGMYLKELSTRSYTTEGFVSGAKPERGEARVSIFFCVNATGSSHARAATVEALRPLVIGAHLARGIQLCPEVPITSLKHANGYMTWDLFKDWLHSLDDKLTNRSLLLIDSCGAYGKSSGKDPLTGEIWRHLQIERLPPNSTSVTQPLDQGIINVFKRQYLEMVSNKAVTQQYATGRKIANGEAWSLIPYAWSHVKAATVRHCFCKAGVLSKAQVDRLERESLDVEEQTPLYPPVADTDVSRVKGRYVRLIASVMDGDRIQFSLDKTQKDSQDMAEEIKQKVHNKIAKRYGPRDRSSSIEQDAVESFKSMYQGQSLATTVVEMLADKDSTSRKAARSLICKSKQK